MKLSNEMKQIGAYVDASKDCSGTSLFEALPDAKHANVKKHFGNSFSTQRQHKYSPDRHLFMIQNHIVTLYMCFGVWRFGCHDSLRNDPFALAKLEQIKNLLEA